jgi:ABC-type amino acid transport substrate-binding protein
MCLFRIILIGISFAITINMPVQALTLGVEDTNYAPYFYLDNQKRFQGAAREIFDLFSETSDLNISFSPMPVPRLFNEFVKGNVELKFPDNPLWSASLTANVKVHYSAPVLNITESLMVLEQEPAVAKKEIKLVGTILGFSIPGIAEFVANHEFETVKTREIEQLMHMLVSNRVQGVYFNENVARNLVKKIYPNKSLIRHSQYPPFKYAYHLSSIKHPKLIEQFNAFLISHHEELDAIRSRYGLK